MQKPTRSQDLGSALKTLRVTSGLLQRDVAVIAGMSPETLSKIENGRRDIDDVTRETVIAAIMRLVEARRVERVAS